MEELGLKDGVATEAAWQDQSAVANRAPVLARVPDLENEEVGGDEQAKSDGRLLSQGLSIKLLVGGGVVLLLAAFLIVRPGSSDPDTGDKPDWNPGVPASDAEEAPSFDGATAEAPSTHPAWKGQVNVLPAAKDTPSWREPAQAPPVEVSPGLIPPSLANQTTQISAESPPTTYDGHYEARRPGPRFENGSPTPGPEVYQPRVRTNRPMSIGEEAPIQPRTYPSDYRSENRTSQSRAEPGVARLEGIITKPPVRTTYERSGSGVY